jgi:hypothetical protein
MIFGKDKRQDNYWDGLEPEEKEWDKSRCDPYNRPGHECEGIEPYELKIPEVPNIVSITNMLSETANIKIETPRTPIDYYRIYVKKYEIDGTYLEMFKFHTTEFSPNIPTQVFQEGHVYKVYAVAVNEAGESGRSNIVKIDTEKNKIEEYPPVWVPPGEVTEILCDLGIGCEDTLVCK